MKCLLRQSKWQRAYYATGVGNGFMIIENHCSGDYDDICDLDYDIPTFLKEPYTQELQDFQKIQIILQKRLIFVQQPSNK